MMEQLVLMLLRGSKGSHSILVNRKAPPSLLRTDIPPFQMVKQRLPLRKALGFISKSIFF